MTEKVDWYLKTIISDSSDSSEYAFRGQARSDWLLVDGATRRFTRELGEDVILSTDVFQDYVDYHQNLIDKAFARGFGIENGHKISDLQLLAKLQHFGAATCLLDFTWNPLTALWFACQDVNNDGRIFSINTNNPTFILRIPNDEKQQTVNYVFSEQGNVTGLFYWEPMVSGDASTRILRQRSVFIVGPSVISCKNNIVIRSTVIPKNDKLKMIEELELLDVSMSSLFYDIYGLASLENQSNHLPRPIGVKYYYLQGNKYFQGSEYTKAYESYSKAITRAEESVADRGFLSEVYFRCGNALAECGDHEKALASFDKTVSLGTDLSIEDIVYFNRANAKAELGRYESAIDDFNETILRNSSDPARFFNRANAQYAVDHP